MMTRRSGLWARIGRAALTAFACLVAGGVNAAETLDIYFVNAGRAFGANATVLVGPSGESAMLDAGLPSQAPRVLELFKQAGVKQLDYLVNTHYHADHYGGTAALAEGIRVVNFIDHGDNVEYGKSDEWWKERRTGAQPGVGKRTDAMYDDYLKAVQKGRRWAVKAGDTIPIKGITMKVVCAGGKVISEPLAGAGKPNPFCAEAERRGDDDAEDAQSIGVLVTYGAFRFIYLGDLTWNVSLDLFCPRNRVGTVDAYLITHHAQSFDDSRGPYWYGLSAAPKAEVHALHPRVAILSLGSNGHPRGDSKAMETVLSSPGLEDLWQTDLVRAGGEANHNAPERFIANLSDEPKPELRYIKLSAHHDGSFTVTNSRMGVSKEYPLRTK
jgi:beta-lactamase superfamily II metal-dependent hydrolase